MTLNRTIPLKNLTAMTKSINRFQQEVWQNRKQMYWFTEPSHGIHEYDPTIANRAWASYRNLAT